MADDVASQLESLLQQLQALKPPGASKGKIAAITTLCVDNVKSDTFIVQKLLSHFKQTPTSHKLGILFVVDSVTRQWVEKAKQAGQSLTDAAPVDGTFASGVFKMSNRVSTLIEDMIDLAPPDQKAKVQNLVDIWRRGNTFPAKIAELEALSKKEPKKHVPSTTPPGSPPPNLSAAINLIKPAVPQLAPQQPAAPKPQDAASILAALAGLARPLPAAAPTPAVSAPPPAQSFAAAPQDITALLSGLGGRGPPQQANTPSVPGPGMGYPQAPPAPFMPPAATAPPSSAQPGLAALTGLIPPHILADPNKLAQVLTLFQELLKAGIPQDQWAPVVAQLYPQAQQSGPPAGGWQGPQGNSGYDNPRGAPYGGYDQRRRSRSPGFDRGQGYQRRGSPPYGTNGNHNDGGDRYRRQDYRQRSPLSARDDNAGPPLGAQTKWTEIDRSMAPGHIKVLSRTLFVGGANGNESDIRQFFGRFGKVQTCIANVDKRHAFVKMCRREDAVRARNGMDTERDQDVLAKARQTKWGVGFGPRDCCDYSNGVSTIPIDRLTDADHKWVLTAEYGGTGGRPIESGLVMEEPDIEIGAGVSSKAMSRRVIPELGRRGRNDYGNDVRQGNDRGRDYDRGR